MARHYNQMRPLCTGRRVIEPSILKSLAEIFVKYAAHDAWGISLLHRHFLIPDDHAMVHTDQPLDHTVVCRPEKLGSRTIFPCMFCLNGDGQAFAMEYSRYPTPLPNESFLLELANFLHKHDYQDTLGLSVVSPGQMPLVEYPSYDGKGTIALRMGAEIDVLRPTTLVTEWVVLADDLGRAYVRPIKECKETESGAHKPQS